jgi:hypothetical protein
MVDGPRRLSAAAIALVLIGVALVVSIAFAAGSDIAVVFYLAPVVLLGVIVIAAAVKMRGGGVRPAECADCGGLISPNAPYCKHCGAPVD